MTEASNGMSMFDYDARPVTPQVVLVGQRASSVGYSIRDFLSRNGVHYEWVDLDDAERLSRQPLPLETNLPGLFAAGDVRSGSIKRCAAAIGEGSMLVWLVHQRLAELGGEGH